MLLDNFKPLLFFGGNGTFIDVSGATRAAKTVLTALNSPTTDFNNHSRFAAGRSFDYRVTTGTNTYTKEKTAYPWSGIVANGTASVTTENYANNAMNAFVLFVGSGSTAVTSSDYCLADTVELTVTGASCSTSASGFVTTSRTFENNTGSDVVIREVGLYVVTYTSDSNQYAVMIGRKVLENPITIPNGEQRSFEYIIDMNNISFAEADS